MNENRVIRRLDHAGKFVLRYGLALVLLWIGAMKFTEYEATGIQPLVENSFLLRWVYSLFSVQMFAALLGIFEIVIGLLIALRPIAPKPSAVGSALAAIMFLVTGAQSGRLSGTLGGPRTVCSEGHRLPRGRALGDDGRLVRMTKPRTEARIQCATCRNAGSPCVNTDHVDRRFVFSAVAASRSQLHPLATRF
jgi:uncharacterized membrane protein YphA (DoxX/SURF4 family)